MHTYIIKYEYDAGRYGLGIYTDRVLARRKQAARDHLKSRHPDGAIMDYLMSNGFGGDQTDGLSVIVELD